MKFYFKLLFVLIFILLICLLFKIETKRIPLNLEVGNRIGLSGDSDVIDFGVVPPGGLSNKKIKINEKGFIHVLIYGDIKKFISISKNNAFIDNEELSLIAVIPENENEKEYNGEMIIKILKWRIN